MHDLTSMTKRQRKPKYTELYHTPGGSSVAAQLLYDVLLALGAEPPLSENQLAADHVKEPISRSSVRLRK